MTKFGRNFEPEDLFNQIFTLSLEDAKIIAQELANTNNSNVVIIRVNGKFYFCREDMLKKIQVGYVHQGVFCKVD